MRELLGLFAKFRSKTDGLSRSPGTAELLVWVEGLRRSGVDTPKALRDGDPGLEASLSALAKTREDLRRAKDIIDTWKGH